MKFCLRVFVRANFTLLKFEFFSTVIPFEYFYTVISFEYFLYVNSYKNEKFL